MKYLLVILLICIMMLGCKSSTEPNDNLEYVIIKFEDTEIVGDVALTYCAYYSPTEAFVSTSVPCYRARGAHIDEGEDFRVSKAGRYIDFHCKTVDRKYVEVAKK